MVEMHDGETLELGEDECSQYIMDDWGWRREFYTSNSTYSMSARKKLDEEEV
jgi:hypothetical protein